MQEESKVGHGNLETVALFAILPHQPKSTLLNQVVAAGGKLPFLELSLRWEIRYEFVGKMLHRTQGLASTMFTHTMSHMWCAEGNHSPTRLL